VVERREDERADAAAAHGQPGGHGPFLVEVVRDDDDGRHVAQRQPEPGYETERYEQREQRVGERGYDEPGGRDYRADHGHLLAPVPVGQEAGDGPGQQGHGHEQRPDPGRLAFALLEVLLELDEYDAERERHAVRDHVHHERSEHDHPTPAAVRGLIVEFRRRRRRRRLVRIGGGGRRRVRGIRIVYAVVVVLGTAAPAAAAVVVRRFVVLVERHVVPILYGYFTITLIVTTIATPIAVVVAAVPRPGRFVTTLVVVRLLADIILNAPKEITGFFWDATVRVFQRDVLGFHLLLGRVVDVVRHSVNSRCLLLRFLAPILLMRLQLLGDALLTARRRSPSQR